MRNAFYASIDEALLQQSQSALALELFSITSDPDGSLNVEESAEPKSTAYWVAVYDNSAQGELLAVGGGTTSVGAQAPEVPGQISLSSAYAREGEVIDLVSADGTTRYRATVSLHAFSSGSGASDEFYPQLIATSTVNVERYTQTYIAIFTALSTIALAAGAFLTRGVVTLAFRRLSQVEATAMSIAAGDFSQRLTEVEPRSTEVGRLKAAINTMLGRLDSAISQRDASVRQMRRFVGDASHELRTPLVTVRGYAELYRIGAITSPDDTAQAMERIEKEAKRMTVLVEDLLALARLDERRAVEFVPIDLRPIARDAAMDVGAAEPNRVVRVVDTTEDSAASSSTDTAVQKPLQAPPRPELPRTTGRSMLRRKPRTAPTRGIEPVSTPPRPPLPSPVEQLYPIVTGEENKIRQVVANLLGNARRFTPEDAGIDIAVGVDRVTGMGWIAIADHGEGIPPEIREQIFQRFWRADTSRARETGGSGLGLAIVASIVESLHGSIVVSETPGGGATFRVSFPLAKERSTEDHAHIETQPISRIDLAELEKDD